MAQTMCPGQDTKFWGPNDIFETACAHCGAQIEFFKDDASRRCPGCGQKVANPKLNLGCAQWCEHAKDCLGYDPKEALAEHAAAAGGGGESLLDRLLEAMKATFGRDSRRIEHAQAVLANAQELMKAEGGDPKVILAAAVLHDIGIQAAEAKHGSAAGRWQELEGPPIAEAIMKDLGLDMETRDHVGRIIANHHSAKDIDTLEFRIIWDSDWLVNIPEEFPEISREKMAKLIGKVFKTNTGRRMARNRFLND
ncbi:MAG: HD domain-containing protein [Desulfarculaceae bacterium]|nr:HD domain-containing protein [Desulfarculaceae bacterium]MCF8048899.1 HD domain-containing protein [Desulfarculaceae bacterium]MCF8097207.1 HD domain-containing protein [Desulfarculaceae bacterium]MCF8122752.1 HD domain-containing protein [Desulfarculaceae bacterium]